MKPTWEQIIDYARGIASEADSKLVEADPDAMREVQNLQSLVQASTDNVPENWMNRAKALLVSQPNTIPLLRGVLNFANGGLNPGFRSFEGATNRAVVTFADATLEVQTEPSTQQDEIIYVGVIESSPRESIRVGTASHWLTFTDEDGQFSIQIPTSERILRFEFLISGKVYEVQINHEN